MWARASSAAPRDEPNGLTEDYSPKPGKDGANLNQIV
jgi:hypothetical protein